MGNRGTPRLAADQAITILNRHAWRQHRSFWYIALQQITGQTVILRGRNAVFLLVLATHKPTIPSNLSAGISGRGSDSSKIGCTN